MVFDFKPFKQTTSSCFYAIILMVLSGLHELRCNEHALDFQKNSKCCIGRALNAYDSENVHSIYYNDIVFICINYWMTMIVSLFSMCIYQFQFVLFGQLKERMSIYHAI